MQKVFKRADPSIPLYQTPQSVKDYIKATYFDTGLITQLDTYIDDGKTKVSTFIFSSPEVEARFVDDPNLQANVAARREYNAANGITESRTQD